MSRLDKITCTRLIKFDAGHRIYGHENKCGHLHGHEYFCRFYARRPENLDHLGRVIDFSVIKEVVGGWIDRYLDHGMILWEKDPLALWFRNKEIDEIDTPTTEDVLIKSPLYGQKYFLLPNNPTAENLAAYLKEIANGLLKDYGIEIYKVKCRETSNCESFAEA